MENFAHELQRQQGYNDAQREIAVIDHTEEKRRLMHYEQRDIQEQIINMHLERCQMSVRSWFVWSLAGLCLGAAAWKWFRGKWIQSLLIACSAVVPLSSYDQDIKRQVWRDMKRGEFNFSRIFYRVKGATMDFERLIDVQDPIRPDSNATQEVTHYPVYAMMKIRTYEDTLNSHPKTHFLIEAQTFFQMVDSPAICLAVDSAAVTEHFLQGIRKYSKVGLHVGFTARGQNVPMNTLLACRIAHFITTENFPSF